MKSANIFLHLDQNINCSAFVTIYSPNDTNIKHDNTLRIVTCRKSTVNNRLIIIIIMIDKFLIGEASDKARNVSPREKNKNHLFWLWEMWNSCTSVFPDTGAWERPE